jgi:hypothetical protein
MLTCARDPDVMISIRRGVIVGLVIGSLVGGTAGATILTATDHGDHPTHATAPAGYASSSAT